MGNSSVLSGNPRKSRSVSVANGTVAAGGVVPNRRSTVSAGSPAQHTSKDGLVAGGDAATLRCPICGVMAPSLFALNVHLDDIHFGSGDVQNRTMLGSTAQATTVRSRYASQDDLEEVKGAILGFFRGAGKAVKGLSNNTGSPSLDATTPPAELLGGWRPGELDGAARGLVTNAHWQTVQAGGRCNVPACGTPLGAGALNCRCCGRLMCATHCARRIRLSAAAQPAPQGVPCRCCDDCCARTATPGRGGGEGQTRSLTGAFAHLRKKAVSAALLEGNRIEKRLEKLALAHSSATEGGDSAPLNGLLAARALQQAEQAVVVWEDDALVHSCPFCHKPFGRLSSRRHHCRLCGRVVCARTACSALLTVPGAAEIRACVTCEHVVLRQRDRAVRAASQQPSELQRQYLVVREHMRQVEESLPTFSALAARLRMDGMGGQGAGVPDMARAARLRKQLVVAFNGMDGASKRIAAMAARTQGDVRLHAAIRRAVAQYLQLHMFPLTMLPKPERPSRAPSSASVSSSPLGRRQSQTDDDAGSFPSSTVSTPSVPADLGPRSTSIDTTNLTSSLLSFVGISTTRRTTSDDPSSAASQDVMVMDPDNQARIAAMPQDEKIVSLQVLRDQRQRVVGYIGDAQRDRRLDDAQSLQASLNDLDVELSLLERSL
ncbi:carboxypeptidase Y-deficient [Coemansia sp. RSA 1933]|nr:carboxypeptidase Y-deficient [Coemansia sp. RSA 1933]